MQIEAQYIAVDKLPQKVWLRARKNQLWIEPLDPNIPPFSWPFACISQSENNPDQIILRWLPREDRIEFPNTRAFQNVAWMRKIPGNSHHGTLKRAAFWTACCIACGFGIAVALPVLAGLVPWRVETFLFKHFQPYREEDFCGQHNAAAAANFDRIIKRIYPVYDTDNSFPLEVRVVKADDVNAFATPGGKIFVFDGLLKQAESADEVAGIVAHEIEHVKRRHIMQLIFERAFSLVIFNTIFSSGGGVGSLVSFFAHSQFGQAHEHEADEGSLQRLLTAGIDPAGVANFFQRLEKSTSIPAILTDHPSNESRFELFNSARGGSFTQTLTDAEWQTVKQICD